MPVEKSVDEFGHEMLMRISPGGQRLFLLFNEETIDNLPNLPMRDDDIMQCSYPKAGCHWSWEIIRLLVWGRDEKAFKQDKEHYMIESSTIKNLNELPSPRILNHHVSFDHNPKEVTTKKVKVVYVYRNPKDIAVSYYHHCLKLKQFTNYDAPFSHFLKRYVAGLLDSGDSVFEYVKDWDQGIEKLGSQVIVLSYEDMKKNIMPELRRLADFLEVDADDQTLREVAELTDIRAMRDRKTKAALKSMDKDAVRELTQKTGSEESKANIFHNEREKIMGVVVDEKGNHMMYRKGEIGDWKNHFTVAESEWFDQILKERLGDLKYHKFQYE